MTYQPPDAIAGAGIASSTKARLSWDKAIVAGAGVQDRDAIHERIALLGNVAGARVLVAGASWCPCVRKARGERGDTPSGAPAAERAREPVAGRS